MFLNISENNILSETSSKLSCSKKYFLEKHNISFEMGKFNRINKKKKVAALEIVPKDVETEVLLPESRKSDDAPLKKVKTS